ncbi:uncharacterized protein DNG_04162 [Cephalotrichum gorgonifer]|uniref:DUF1857 domain-containing protein n=1 Tax=Cephalotrichum gorgonifer TaxID=2041049 RepID=A0AAE8MWC0_9PEZI|nr:uncharacterized protein DNG_04162 [Cephalotrichum gorgonifer]
MVAANHVAYTAPINPPGASPVLTYEHIGKLLRRKVHRAEEFVGGAITSTRVLSTDTTTATGRPITVREVTFAEGNRKVTEECVAYPPMKEEFHMDSGNIVQNIISEGKDGELFMTFTFEWLHPELEGDAEGLKARELVEKKMAAVAVENTLRVMREMVKDGRWKEEI